jgi:hypothetical protein
MKTPSGSMHGASTLMALNVRMVSEVRARGRGRNPSSRTATGTSDNRAGFAAGGTLRRSVGRDRGRFFSRLTEATGEGASGVIMARNSLSAMNDNLNEQSFPLG